MEDTRSLKLTRSKQGEQKREETSWVSGLGYFLLIDFVVVIGFAAAISTIGIVLSLVSKNPRALPISYRGSAPIKWPIKNPARPAVNPIAANSKPLLQKDPTVVFAS